MLGGNYGYFVSFQYFLRPQGFNGNAGLLFDCDIPMFLKLGNTPEGGLQADPVLFGYFPYRNILVPGLVIIPYISYQSFEKTSNTFIGIPNLIYLVFTIHYNPGCGLMLSPAFFSFLIPAILLI